jgi:hypothetical protein
VLKEIEAEAALEKCRRLITQINLALSAEQPFVNVSSVAELLLYLEFATFSKRPRHPRESEERRNDAEFAYLPDEQTCTCLRRNHIPSSALNALFAADDQWAAGGREGSGNEKMHPMSRKTRIRCPLP